MKAATLAKAARSAPGKTNRSAGGWTLRLASWLLLVLVACADEGKEEYQAAYERYQALVSEGRLPSDPAFDEVLKRLDAVPASSAASGKAKSLKEAILRSRRRFAPRPLASVSGADAGTEEPEVQARKAECARLAAALGTAAPEGREEAARRVQACQAELQKLEEQKHEDAPR